MREDLIERSKFLDVLNYFMRKHPEMPLSEIERKNHLSQGLLIKTAYNNKSNYMRLVTFDKYCEMLEKCEEEQNDRDRLNSQKYKWTTLECYGCPYNIHIQNDLEMMKELLPCEYFKANHIWKPVYEEYKRIGYRIKKEI